MLEEPDDKPLKTTAHPLSRPTSLAAILAAGVLFFSLTSPESVPSVLLIVGFLALGGILYSILRLLLLATGLQRRLPRPYRRGLLLTGTVLPVLLLMLQSIGQLTLRDILIMGGLFLLGVFYVNRVTR